MLVLFHGQRSMTVPGAEPLTVHHLRSRGAGCWLPHVPKDKDDGLIIRHDHVLSAELPGRARQQGGGAQV